MAFSTRFIALLIGCIYSADAKVEFTHSIMYDIYDFENVGEIILPKLHCNDGCLLYASTMSESQGYGTDPFIANLHVYSEDAKLESIADVAAQFQPGTSRKVALNLPAGGKYTILNLNALDAKGSDVVVWVIDRATAKASDYEIYDAAAMARAPAPPRTVVTIMSAARFTLYADKGEANSYVAWLTGFDNALNANPDKCTYAFQSAVGTTTFEGFEFPIQAPIISLVFAKKNVVNLKANFTFLVSSRMSKPGFITSPGYNGCDKVPKDQVFRAKFYHDSEQFELHGEPDFYKVNFDSKMYLDSEHPLVVTDLTKNQNTILSGQPLNYPFTFDQTQIVTVYYHALAAPQSFLLRFTAELVERGTPPTTVASQSTSTSATSISTTSAVGEVTALTTMATLFMLLAYR